ncbi:MAG: energy transducer TonB [Desulfobacteraceae bacterium]|nr:energy transducer TonB [Desulfobacteraceae bacterium]
MTLRINWIRLSVALTATVLINAFLFAGLPLLTRATKSERSTPFESAIMIAHIKPPKPPEEIKKRELKERKLKQMQKQQTDAKAAKPKLDVSEFDFAPDMEGGIGGMSIGSMTGINGFKTEMQKIEFELSEVDNPPRVTRRVPAMYPFSAKRRGIKGKVLIRCLVGIDGIARKHRIISSEPEGVFDEAALSALERWRFKPGILGGEPVPTWVRVPFVFELK